MPAPPRPKSLPRLSLAVQYAASTLTLDRLPSRAQIRRWLAAACDCPTTVTVRFVDAAESRQLNAAFRHQDKPTNILAFPYAARPHIVGDLVLCVTVAQAEAQAQEKPFFAHLAHLLVHGMLHLAGYEHEGSLSAAQRMEAQERKILARFRIPDPYRDDVVACA